MHRICFALMCWLLSSIASAADLNAGKDKAVACQGCHGANGISSNPQWPNLAGQESAYIEAQLNHFKAGSRLNPIMKPIAEGLSPADIQNMAAYFASLPGKPAGGDAVLAKQGQAKTAMCQGCHGDKFQGKQQVPKLAGQHPQYLLLQLQNYKKGERKASPMNAMVQSLSDDDLKSIAEYLGAFTH